MNDSSIAIDLNENAPDKIIEDEESAIMPSPINIAILLAKRHTKVLVGCTTLLSLSLYFLGFIFTLFIIFSATTGAALWIQRALLYHPLQPADSRTNVLTPLDIPGLDTLPFEEFYLESKDGVKLHSYFLIHPSNTRTSAATVIYFHGNAGNIGHRLFSAGALFKSGVNVFVLEYRGYGKSTGSPSESGLLMDAKAAHEFVRNFEGINPDEIFLFGRSLGGAVAIGAASEILNDYTNQDKHVLDLEQVAHHIPLRGVIIENTFTSLPDIGLLLIPISKYLPRFMFLDVYDNLSKIQTFGSLKGEMGNQTNIRANNEFRVLFMSGSQDELIPVDMMRQLYESCGCRRKIIAKFPNGQHNNTWQSHGYHDIFMKFIKESNVSEN